MLISVTAAVLHSDLWHISEILGEGVGINCKMYLFLLTYFPGLTMSVVNCLTFVLCLISLYMQSLFCEWKAVC